MTRDFPNEQMIMDLHTHTTASVHAYSTLMENAIAAKDRGLEILGTSDHGYGMKDTTHRTFWKNLSCLPDYLEGVRVLKGMEANLQNRQGDVMEEDLLGEVDYVIVSLHSHCYDRDTGDVNDYTEGVVNALRRYPQINILGHPDDGAFPIDARAVVQACKDYHVALEVNNSSYVEGSYRQDPKTHMRDLLAVCKELEVPIILGSDAHIYTAVGGFGQALEFLAEENFPEELIINSSWEKLSALLGRKL